MDFRSFLGRNSSEMEMDVMAPMLLLRCRWFSFQQFVWLNKSHYQIVIRLELDRRAERDMVSVTASFLILSEAATYFCSRGDHVHGL